MKNVFAFFLCFLLTGCAAKIPVHPGSISNLDSYTYDVLLVEQDAINNAKTAFQAGTIPAAAKGPLNDAIKQYDVALGAWQGYHAGLTKDTTALQSAIDALIGAVAALEQALGKTLPSAVLLGPRGELPPAQFISQEAY